MTDNSNDSRAPRERREPGGQRDFRKSRNAQDSHDARARKPLREVVCEIDRDILRLLLRRNNLLERMRGIKPRLDSTEEKSIRESWEAAVSRVSRDARLSGHFFSLMQEVEFQPRPAASHADDEDGSLAASAAQEAPRTAFNLAPTAKPVRLNMTAPLACRATRAWLMLAAATGQPLHLAPSLMNDPIVDCVKMLNQAGASHLQRDAARRVAHQHVGQYRMGGCQQHRPQTGRRAGWGQPVTPSRNHRRSARAPGVIVAGHPLHR